jgi:hypothetical protein
MVARPKDAAALEAAIAVGDADALAIVRAVLHFIDLCGKASPGDPDAPICLSCEKAFSTRTVPAAIVLVFPVKTCATMMGTGICPECARSDAELVAEQCRLLRGIRPDMQVSEARGNFDD